MNAANPVILERALTRPPKEAEPQLRGDSVGSDRYTCGDYLKREYQNVWHTVWNIGGVAYQMPEPGDYLTTELGIDSIIMVRQEDGSHVCTVDHKYRSLVILHLLPLLGMMQT